MPQRIAGSPTGPTCPVTGCGRPAVGPATSFHKAPLLLCSQHRAEYVGHRESWDGSLDPTGHVVVQLRPIRARHRTRP